MGGLLEMIVGWSSVTDDPVGAGSPELLAERGCGP